MEAYNYRVYFGKNNENFLLVYFENDRLLKIDKHLYGCFVENVYHSKTNL